MYLEKLEIQGFKSFATKNKLIFPGLIAEGKKGLTSVVGPNGSGKSNIADAIRWVLGEQSLKTLRGKKSEDIIFAGSDKKNQLGMAEVSLFLNNQDKSNLRDFSETDIDETTKSEVSFDKVKEFLKCAEIVITRRIYRNGDSEYLINNNRVRLADIQMLLARASVGQKTYSVIGQGMVESFLNTNASERKDFFDEATGIKQFQIKRDSSLNKLEHSYENLQQVEMLLSEIRPRIKSLTRQVEKLKKRSALEVELKDNQLNYYSYLYNDANTKLENANKKFLDLEKIKISNDDKLAKLNEGLEKIKNTNNFQEINELQPQLKELEAQKNQLLKQLTRLQAELEIQLESQGQFDVSWLNNKQVELNSNLEQKKSEILSLENRQESYNEAGLQTELQLVAKKIDQAYNVRKEIDKKEAEKEQFFRQINKLDATLEAHLEAQGQFDVSWLKNKHEELLEEIKIINQEVEILEKDKNSDTEAKLRELHASISEKNNKLNQELNTIKKELSNSPTQENHREEISAIVSEFLEKLELVEKESDLIKAKLLLTTAKNNFQEKIKEFLADENAAKLNRIKEIQDEIIYLNEERQNINNNLNDEKLRLSSINERLRMLEGRKNQVNRELEDVKSKLAKSQIKFDASKIESEKDLILKQISILEAEIKELWQHAKTKDLHEQRQNIQSKINELRFTISSNNEKLRLLKNQQTDIERELEDIKNKLIKSQVKFDASKIENEKLEINKALDILNKQISELEDKLNALNLSKEEEKSKTFELQNRSQMLQQDITSISSQLNDLKVEATRQETKLEDLESNIRNNELSFQEIKDHKISDNDIDLGKWQKKINDSKNQLETIGGIDPETEKEYQETKERYDFLSNQTNDLNSAIKSLEKIIAELDVNIKNRFDREFKIISEKFTEYFKILFSGGNARIFKLINEEPEADIITEEKNLSENNLKKIKLLKKKNALGLSGIEIEANPPGKKIQSVSVLSGGEKALTAIALICAIISANPSPFVVLDEVDAALDEANSERLAQILDDLSDKTQFVVITHNRASMKKANMLYGVTMQNDGVSKLLSVKLEDVANKQGL